MRLGQQQKQTSSCMCGRTEFKRERRNWFGLFGEMRRKKDGNNRKAKKKKLNNIRKDEEFKWAIRHRHHGVTFPASGNSNKRFNSLVPEATFPEVRSIRLCDAELITGKYSVRKNGFQLAEHVREDKTELR